MSSLPRDIINHYILPLLTYSEAEEKLDCIVSKTDLEKWCSYKQPHGKFICCSRKHEFARQEFYHDGKLHGVRTYFYDNGNEYCHYTYKNGILDGETATYTLDGTLMRREIITPLLETDLNNI